MKVTTNTWEVFNRRHVEVRCPYCDNLFRIAVQAGSQVVICDSDDTPGCDKEFVVKLPTYVTIEVQSLSIEAQ